jgi:16S rRNA (cytidine1402-2'-O)-methyltransferase
MKGVLYLVPNILGNPDTSLTIPEGVKSGIRHIRLFMVEDLRNARRFLKSLDRDFPIDDLTFFEQHKHASPEDIPAFLDRVEQGSDGALLSEAGLPGVADPGAAVVSLAHERGIRVVPFTGPSSILLSLMASGMNGQYFSFHGYLSVKRPERIKKIRELEQDVIRKGETQVFIEAPYRNDALLADILETVHPSTRICVAADLTMDTEFILTLPAGDWKKKKPALHKRPAIFLIGR